MPEIDLGSIISDLTGNLIAGYLKTISENNTGTGITDTTGNLIAGYLKTISENLGSGSSSGGSSSSDNSAAIQEIKSSLAGKLDMISNTSNLTRIYIQTPQNAPTTPNTPSLMSASKSNIASDIVPIRGADGNIFVQTDKTKLVDNSAVPKSYVDQLFASSGGSGSSDASGAYKTYFLSVPYHYTSNANINFGTTINQYVAFIWFHEGNDYTTTWVWKYDYGVTSWLYSNDNVRVSDDPEWYFYSDRVRINTNALSPAYVMILPITNCSEVTCFLEGTKVLTEEGEKNIEDVTEKDRVGYYSRNNSKLQFDQVIIPLETGVCSEYEAYSFSDGTVLKIFGDDRIYDYDLDRNKSTREWKPGDRALKNDGTVVTFLGKETVTLDSPARRFHLITQNGCKCADGIRVGHDKGEVWHYLQRPEYSKYIPDNPSLVEKFKMYHKRYIAVKNYFYSEEFYEASREDRNNISSIRRSIDNHKKYLDDTDYIVIKYMDGALSEDEYLPVRDQRASARASINALESDLSAALTAFEARKKLLKTNFISHYVLES